MVYNINENKIYGIRVSKINEMKQKEKFIEIIFTDEKYIESLFEMIEDFYLFTSKLIDVQYDFYFKVIKPDDNPSEYYVWMKQNEEFMKDFINNKKEIGFTNEN